MSEKVYAGHGKVVEKEWGKEMRLSLMQEDVVKLQNNIDKGWVNMSLKKRKEPSPSGFTHYLEVETWKPDSESATTEAVEDLDSMPF